MEERCPHCARPSRFPNVITAEQPEEQNELNNRYNIAQKEAEDLNILDVFKDFENEVRQNSKAVINRSISELKRLSENTKQIYATYYQLTESEIRIPEGSKWDILRSATDSAMFGIKNRKHVRFAALTLDGRGLLNYGDCALIPRNDLIAHRSSVFEENSVMFMKNHNILVFDLVNLPKGYRATWFNRGKLSAIKHTKSFSPTTKNEDYPGILLEQGDTNEDDVFIEVHIWGPMTILTFEKVFVKKPATRVDRLTIKDLKTKLDKKYSISLVVI